MPNIKKGEKEPPPTTSEWIVVRNSEVHGKGVFAAKNIPKDTKIIEYSGILVTKKEADKISGEQFEKGETGEEGHVYLFELNKKYDINGNVPWNTARLINHSCDPNCETDGDDKSIWISAIKDIKKGEELNYDYGYDIDDFENHPCVCGSKNCIGYILAEKKRGKLRKKLRYRKNREKRKSNGKKD